MRLLLRPSYFLIKQRFLDSYPPNLQTGKPQFRVMSQNLVQDKIVSFEEMNTIAKAGSDYIIDVRRREEIEETGSIPNSINVPLNELQDALNMSASDFVSKYQRDKPDPNTKVIFSCKLGGRSAQALQIATALGYNNAYNYSGGWTEWHARTETSQNS